MGHTQLVTSDGHRLEADLAVAEGEVRGGVVLCHPHPRYGGDRFNVVVDALHRALPPAGFHALRFDFRADHDGGVAERLDVAAALDALAQHAPGVPLHVAGYSFGAVVALSTADPRITSVVAVAPPLPMMADVVVPPAAPTLVLAPAHDQFCPPEVAAPIVGAWPHAELEAIDMADHFLAGRTTTVAARAVAWLSAPRPG